MRLEPTQSPQLGDVPVRSGNLPSDAQLGSSSGDPTSSSVSSMLFVPRASVHTTTTQVPPPTGADNLASHHHVHHHYHHHHHHNNAGNVSMNPTSTANTTNSNSRTHVHRSSRKLLHRCTMGTCCRPSAGRCASKGTTTTSSIILNIPLEAPKLPSEVPYPAQRNTQNDFSRDNINNYSVDNASRQIQWQSNTQFNHNIGDNKRNLIVRGLYYPQQQQLQQQPQPQEDTFTVQPLYRKRAINFMMTHLQLRSSENQAALEAVRKRIERLEEQVYASANSKDQYVKLLAIKLEAIMERLSSCRVTRIARPQNHTLNPAHLQPTGV